MVFFLVNRASITPRYIGLCIQLYATSSLGPLRDKPGRGVHSPDKMTVVLSLWSERGEGWFLVSQFKEGRADKSNDEICRQIRGS